MIPDYQSLMLPLLKLVSDGQEHKYRDLIESLAIEFEVTDEERKELDYWYSKKTENVDKVYGVEKIFRRTKVDEKALRLIEKHNEIGQSYLQKIDVPEEKKKPFIELANYLLRRES